jgi:TonB-dependent SusC/RagA subfamily outer membrane receptor
METGALAKEYVFNKNFTLLTRIMTTYQPNTDEFVMPVSQHVRDFYQVDIRELKNIQGRRVAVVSFTPMEEISVPAMEGEVLIDIDSYEILKLDGFIQSDHLEMIGLNNPHGSWENHVLEVEIAYKPLDNDLYLDYITLTQSFDYYIDNVYRHSVKTSSFFTYYEYYTPDKFKRLGGRLIRYGRRDREILDRIGYNRRFWEDNPVVKRTPVEEEIIASFEAQNAFGTIYLNDRDHVQLEKDDLDLDPFIQQIKIDLRKSKLPTTGEKVYLHTDRPYYASGEDIWFNAYIVNQATHVPSDFSDVLYVDLISPEGDILVKKRLHVRDAYSNGNIILDENYSTGRYRIRAYTNWMKNYDAEFFFDRELCIYNTKQVLNSTLPTHPGSIDFDVQFLPEGGHLIHGIPSQIAFKAVDQTGSGIDISGKILNESGEQVAEFQTRHDGMGSFFILPQFGVRYTALVSYNNQERTFKLPEPQLSGYTFSINNLKEKNIQILVKSSADLDDSEFYIIGQTRGVLYHREKGLITRGSAVINIPKAKLPAGIFHITLFDTTLNPRCERLVFINTDNDIFVNMETENEVLRSRDKIKLEFEFTDEFDRSIRNTRFSVAVTDAGHLVKPNTGENIMTNLLLSSDLKGKISNPGYYFMDDDRDTKIALDLVMLTHGWRRFTWKEIFNHSLAETSYSHENGINISGTAYLEGTRREFSNSYINFMSANPEYPGYWSTTTDHMGSFQLRNMIMPDTIPVLTISLNEKGNPVNIDIEMDSLHPFPAKLKNYQRYPPSVSADVLYYLNHFEEKERIEEAYEFSDRIVMKEIEIRGERYDNTIYGEPDHVIEMNDQLRAFTDIFQIIQGRVPGVMVTGQGLQTNIRIRGITSIMGSNEPLFVIDGVPVNSAFSSSAAYQADSLAPVGSSDINSMIMSISPQQVDRIEILKGAATTASFGLRGANGVILIYTRRGLDHIDNTRSQGYEGIRLPGFSYVKEFYSPSYDVPEEEHVIPDKRTTLYWNPSVVTNNLGKAEVEFFNSDDARTLQVEIQGVTDFGDPIYSILNVGADLLK